ncbi:MAG TPA: Mut7-C RNAse domain-containing protein, partial [Spirochaetota bacterium]|nr:Mut7-C RNAse domain-containing protein [Spirochaetota bacterium]
MYRVTIRFYEELNDFLPRQDRKRDIEVSFNGRRSIKDFIESMGVPHVEVDLILVHGISVDFNYLIQDGDRISVYPVFERLSIEGVTRLRPAPLRLTRFVLDVHLRKLARRLRLLGFDTDYDEHRDDPELAELSAKENRILLTRDRGL